MKTLVGIDSIKTFENSVEIGNIFKANLSSDVEVMPFLDGGEGTVEAMQAIIKGKYKYVNVHNPLNLSLIHIYLPCLYIRVFQPCRHRKDQ